MPYINDTGEISVTGGNPDVSSIEWRIPKFLSLTGNEGDYYESPYIDAFGIKWFFEVHPRKKSRLQEFESVNIFLIGLTKDTPQTLHIMLGIKSPKGIENVRERIHVTSESDNAVCWRNFCTRSELSDNQSSLMPDNILKLTCVIKNYVLSVTRSGEKALIEDWGKLLASGEQSDVIIQVGDVEFKVHSLILFARCPPLSVSLQHESKEKATNRIVIEDCEPDIFRDFIHYLYVGSIQSLTEKNVFKLYGVADKYLADSLKQECLEHVQNNLSVQTLCDTIKLSLTYEESGLLQLATDFITKNFPSIVCSVEWKNFNLEYPGQVNEILIKGFGNRS